MPVGLLVEFDAVPKLRRAAKAAGLRAGDVVLAMLELWEWCWRTKLDRLTEVQLLGFMPRKAVGPLEAFGFLESVDGLYRVRGADRYLRIKQAQSDAGKKSVGNLKQNAQQAPAVEEPPPAPKRARASSEQEQYWDILEQLRVEHCVRLGIEPGASKKPKLCNKVMLDAVEAAGILDTVAGGEPFTRWDMLTLLFDRYLAEPFGNEPDREGRPRNPPWPIPLFLSAGVLQRLKQANEAAA